MYIFYTNDYREFKDFNIIQYGCRQCEPNFAPKMTIRDTYLIHYVYKGEGYLEVDGEKFSLRENQAFIVLPGQLATYVASETNPMFYKWIGFYGDKCHALMEQAGFSPHNPIITDMAPYYIGETLSNIVDGGITEPFELMSKFYAFVHALGKGTDKRDRQAYRYVDMAVNYIKYCSDAKLTVQQVADYVNVSRSFLSRMFSEKMGMSPKQYIVKRSMESAVTMLGNNRLSITEISKSLGYGDTIEFTKAFTRYFGMPPSKYRQI